MSSNPEARTTLGTFLRDHFEVGPDHKGLILVIESIANASRELARAIRAADLANILGTRGKVNVQGEVAQILDEIATSSFVEALRENEHVAGLVCEELDAFQSFPGHAAADRYLCAFDPIDGSSNIDVAAPIGSIFGLYPAGGEEIRETSFLRVGRKQIAALYIIYGSSTQLVLAKENVSIFTLDPAEDEFVLTRKNARIPEVGPYYSVNEANADAWDQSIQQAVAEFRKTCSLRYIGTLVSDFHRGLLKGGIFLYPGDQRNPKGKLRLLYEGNPLAFVAEAAGGAASTGSQRILDLVPTSIHERVPLFIGNTSLVQAIDNAQSKALVK